MKPLEIHVHEGASGPDGLPLCPDDPDARVVFRNEGDRAEGHAAVWFSETPLLECRRIGTIGDFSADDPTVAAALLEGAFERLREAGCGIAVGPMNGNTWRHHRFVIESNGRDPFLLEPRNPPEQPAWWEQAGFRILSRYSSSVIRLGEDGEISSALGKRLLRSGVVLRRLEPAMYEEELKRIHSVSLKSFAGNFLYTPLSEEAFLDAYRKVRERVDPDLVMLAERDGATCGFVFGIPDLEALARGEKPALIVKTLAVDPASRCAGLGSWLVNELHRVGREKGYTEAIHALQHDSNSSLKITGRHHGGVFRRYALFSKTL